MAQTVFSTPLIAQGFHYLSRILLKLSGWQVQGQLPDTRRFVLIGVPHTSNWDFVLMLLVVFVQRAEVHWMGKDSIFKAPFGGLMRWLGGIAIDRSRANNTVEQIVECYRTSDDLVLLIPPEGTRSKVKRWKTGFYHIARGAEVPIMLGYIDAATKTVGFGEFFTPTGDIDADMEIIQQFYADKQGIRPELF